MWSWIHGNGDAMLLNDSAVVARHCTLAVAPAIVDAMNQTEHVESTSERCAALHEIIVELYSILDLRLDTTEAEGRSVRDDRGRARQLLELAGAKRADEIVTRKMEERYLAPGIDCSKCIYHKAGRNDQCPRSDDGFLICAASRMSMIWSYTP